MLIYSRPDYEATSSRFYLDGNGVLRWKEKHNGHAIAGTVAIGASMNMSPSEYALDWTYEGRRYRVVRKVVIFILHYKRLPVGPVRRKDKNKRNDHPSNLYDEANLTLDRLVSIMDRDTLEYMAAKCAERLSE